MGLITKEVEIKWSPKNKKYYENLGYLYTKTNNYFRVFIYDLAKESHETVNIRCDGCGKIFEAQFRDYNKCVRSDNSYYCLRCSRNNDKKWVSFAEWGINEFGDDFLDRYWDYELNEVNPYDITKSQNNICIHIKCQEKEYHGSYETTPNSFRAGCRCGFCDNHHGNVHELDRLGVLFPEVLNLWSNKNGNESPYEYAPQSNNDVWWKCDNGIHDDYKRKINTSNILCNFKCPSCAQERQESFLQERVRLYLESFGAYVYHEQFCSLHPKNIIKHKSFNSDRILKYDNEIVFYDNIRIFIEVHGVQHYEIGGFHKLQSKQYSTSPKYELKYIQKKDAFKKQYVLDSGFDYLEIPYWTDDDDETWKSLIDDKINEVLNR